MLVRVGAYTLTGRPSMDGRIALKIMITIVIISCNYIQDHATIYDQTKQRYSERGGGLLDICADDLV